jgi:hypothetical protein
MNQSGHWTNDELLAAIYGLGPSGNHLEICADCRTRLAGMKSNREAIEGLAGLPVDAAFLAAQRRAVYQRLDQPARSWKAWAAGLTTACALSASLFLYQHNQQMKVAQESMNDAKLMQEVAAMANDTGASSMAPLEGLFE